jgi:hypothetical protein
MHEVLGDDETRGFVPGNQGDTHKNIRKVEKTVLDCYRSQKITQKISFFSTKG